MMKNQRGKYQNPGEIKEKLPQWVSHMRIKMYVRKFQVIYSEKDSNMWFSLGDHFMFSNCLFCVILQGENVLSSYVQNVIPSF